MRLAHLPIAHRLAVACALALGGCAPSAIEGETGDTGDTGDDTTSESGSESSESSTAGDGDTGDGDGTSSGDGDGTSTGDGDGTSSGDGDGTSSGDGDGTSSGDGDGTSSGDGDGTTGDGDGCVTGDLGCDCFGNQTCFQPYLCDNTNTCISPVCNDGELGCPCFPNQTCFQGLICGPNNTCEQGGDGDGDGDGDGTCLQVDDQCGNNGECCSGFCYSDFGGGGVTPSQCQANCIDPGEFVPCDDDGDCCGSATCDMSGFVPQCVGGTGDGDGDGDIGDGETCGSAYELSVGTSPVTRMHTTVGGGSHNNDQCTDAGSSDDRTYDIQTTASGTLQVTVVPSGNWDTQVHSLDNCLDPNSGNQCENGGGGGATEVLQIGGVGPGDVASVVVDGVGGDDGDYVVTFQVI
jgi:hypothetical protein